LFGLVVWDCGAGGEGVVAGGGVQGVFWVVVGVVARPNGWEGGVCKKVGEPNTAARRPCGRVGGAMDLWEGEAGRGNMDHHRRKDTQQ